MGKKYDDYLRQFRRAKTDDTLEHMVVRAQERATNPDELADIVMAKMAREDEIEMLAHSVVSDESTAKLTAFNEALNRADSAGGIDKSARDNLEAMFAKYSEEL